MPTRSQEAYDQFRRTMEAPMLVASIAFAVLLVTPMLARLPDGVAGGFEVGLWLIWAIFVFEYLGLLFLAPDRWHMARTHVLDLLIVAVPFLRPLRLLRLIGVAASIGRTSQAFSRMTQRSGFRWYLGLVILVIIAAGLLFYAAEVNQPGATVDDVADGLWWAVVTTTTVGYGDHVPSTNEGRAIATVLMLVGISLISVVTANIATYFVRSEEESNENEVIARLERIEQHLAALTAAGGQPTR
jgi:voltage-gated potassium channel